MKQVSKEVAIKIYDSGKWKRWTAEQKVKFQLFQDRLCMPFGDFHAAMQEVLGRPVWTHEFAFRDKLIAEYKGKRQRPSFEDIIGLLPEDKTIVILR